jgi:hypothetical protein
LSPGRLSVLFRLIRKLENTSANELCMYVTRLYCTDWYVICTQLVRNRYKGVLYITYQWTWGLHISNRLRRWLNNQWLMYATSSQCCRWNLFYSCGSAFCVGIIDIPIWNVSIFIFALLMFVFHTVRLMFVQCDSISSVSVSIRSRRIVMSSFHYWSNYPVSSTRHSSSLPPLPLPLPLARALWSLLLVKVPFESVLEVLWLKVFLIW